MLQTVGEKLRAERERKGLSLKEVEIATNIRSHYLNAIEDGNYSALPGEAYVKGFIRNYANALNLDGSAYVDLYRQELQPVVVEQPSTAPEAPTPARSTAEKLRESRKQSSSLWLVITVALILLLAGAVWWYLADGQQAQKTPPQPSLQTQQTPPPAGRQPQINSAPTAPAVPAAPAAKPVVVVAKFTNRSWIQVTADGKPVYEGIPQSGESMTWQADQTVVIKAGNAGAVELTHNGQTIGKMGNSGEVVLRSFTATGRQ